MPTTVQLFTPTAASSGDITAAATNLNAATLIVGDTTDKRGVLRFDTSAIGATDEIYGAYLYIKVNAKGAGFSASTKYIELWAADFGASVTIADHGKGQRNHDLDDTTNPLRVRIGKIALHTNVADDVLKLKIPARFIDRTSSNDFELRFISASALGSTDTMTFDGAASSTGSYVIDDIEGVSAATISDEKPRLAILYYTQAEIAALPDPCIPGVDSEAFVGFDMEDTCGYPVKALHLLDVSSADLDSQAENLVSNTIRSERAAVVKMAIGREGAGGSVSFQATPEKWTKLLRGFFKITGTVDEGGGVYTKTFKIAQTDEIKFYTFVEKKSQDYFAVYPGCIMNSLSMSIDLDSFVECNLDLMARTMYHYDKNAVGDDDRYVKSGSAGYDSDSPLSFTGAQVQFNDVVSTDVRNVSISFNNNAGEVRSLNRNRRVKQHFPGKLAVSASFEMYFNDFNALRKFLGDTSKDFPFKAERTIQFDKFQVDLAGPDGEDTQEISIIFPQMSYTVIRVPVQGSGGPIMLSAQGEGTFYASDSTNVTVTVTSSENEDFYDPSTDTITVVPAEEKLLTI